MSLHDSRETGFVMPLHFATGTSKGKTPPTTPKKDTFSPAVSRTISPWNAENKHRTFEQKKRIYLQHLREWSLNHDASTLFHGSIELHEPALQVQNLELGRSVRCMLISSLSFSPLAGRIIVIRLFAPREAGGRYTLVMRCGGGWESARGYLSRMFFMCWKTIKSPVGSDIKADRLSRRQLHLKAKQSQPEAEIKDGVAIRPLFQPFMQLPTELQQQVLAFAMHKQDVYSPGKERTWTGYRRSSAGRISNSISSSISSSADFEPPTRLSSILSLSKSLSEQLTPWIYRTTTFHCGTQGFTNFLWLAGPTNRSLINKITLKFGPYALLHCIRWFAPDPIYTLFDPRLELQPQGLKYYWRYLIQSLLQDLHLQRLVIDLEHVPKQDIPLVVGILQGCFGSIDSVYCLFPGTASTCYFSLEKDVTWADLCRDAFVRYRRVAWHEDCFSEKRRAGEVEDLDNWMEEHAGFFKKRLSWVGGGSAVVPERRT